MTPSRLPSDFRRKTTYVSETLWQVHALFLFTTEWFCQTWCRPVAQSCPPFFRHLNDLPYYGRIKALKLGGCLGQYDTSDFSNSPVFSYLARRSGILLWWPTTSVHIWFPQADYPSHMCKCSLSGKCLSFLSKELAGSDTRGLDLPWTVLKVLCYSHGWWQKPDSVPIACYMECRKTGILPVLWVSQLTLIPAHPAILNEASGFHGSRFGSSSLRCS